MIAGVSIIEWLEAGVVTLIACFLALGVVLLLVVIFCGIDGCS